MTSLQVPCIFKAEQLVSLLELLDTDSNMSEYPTEQVKETAFAAASTSGEWVQQNVVNPVQSCVAGEKTEESGWLYMPIVSQ